MDKDELIDLFDELLNTVKDYSDDQRLIDKVNSIQSYIGSSDYRDNSNVEDDLNKLISNYTL